MVYFDYTMNKEKYDYDGHRNDESKMISVTFIFILRWYKFTYYNIIQLINYVVITFPQPNITLV